MTEMELEELVFSRRSPLQFSFVVVLLSPTGKVLKVKVLQVLPPRLDVQRFTHRLQGQGQSDGSGDVCLTWFGFGSV